MRGARTGIRNPPRTRWVECPEGTRTRAGAGSLQEQAVVSHLHTIERDDELFEAAVALRAEARPLTGCAERLRRAARPDRRRARRPARRGLSRHARVLRRACAHHAPARRRARVHARSRSRATGPTPIASTATCAAPDATVTPRRRSPASAASPRGCGAMRTCSSWSGGCGHAMTACEHASRRVGFYGLDLYSLYESIEAVIAYLDQVDPPAADLARERYACFGQYGGESQEYGRAVTLGVTEPCRRAAVAQLLDLRRRAAHDLRARRVRRGGRGALRRAERARRRGRRGVLPLDVRRSRRVVESARPPHGRHARPADRPPRPACRRGTRRGLGAQLPRR